MRKILFTQFILSVFFACSQNSWGWGKTSIGLSQDQASDLVTDNKGNIYSAGYFKSLYFVIDNDTLWNADTANVDPFLIKYDQWGNVLWAKSGRAPNGGGAMGVAVDPHGNIYLTGFYTGPIYFGTDSLVLGTVGQANVFVVKYDSLGNVIWLAGSNATMNGGSNSNTGCSIQADSIGNVYVGGYFSSPYLSFGSTTVANMNANAADIFLVKYDANGNAKWAWAAGSPGWDSPSKLQFDKEGNILMVGSVHTSPMSIGTYTLTGGGAYDGYLTKCDTAGNVKWARLMGGTGYDQCEGVAVDSAGVIYVAGDFGAYTSSGTITFGSHILTTAGMYDGFIAKYDSSGNPLWATQIAGSNFDWGYRLTKDRSNNLFLFGASKSPSVDIAGTTISLPGGTDAMFVAEFNATDNLVCVSTLASGGAHLGGLATDLSGNTYVGAAYAVNPFFVGNDTLIRTGKVNYFLAEFACDGSTSVPGTAQPLIGLFPNPVSADLQVNSDADLRNISIYDSVGETVWSGAVKGTKVKLDLSELCPGFYVAEIETVHATRTIKFVKE